MADKTVSIKVAAKGASEFKSQMGQCAGAVKALNAESKAIQAEFKATGDEQQFLEKTYANLTKKIEQQRKMVDAAKQALAKLAKDGFGPNSKEVQEWSVSLSKAQASVFETQAAINDTVARVHELGGSFETVGSQADEAAGQTAKVGQSFDTTGVKGSVDEVTKTVDKADDSAGEAKEGIDQIGGSIEDSGLNSSVESIDATIQSADDSAEETKAGIDEIGGDVDSSDLSGSVSEIDAEIQSADDSVAEVKGEIDTMGEGVDIGDLSSSVTDIDTEIQRADDSVDTVRDVIGTLGDEVSTEGIDTSATAIDTAVQGADDSVPEAKAEIASLGEEFDTSGAEGSAEAVHEKIVWAAEGAGAAKDDIAGVGEGFDTGGAEGSAEAVQEAVDEIDGDGAHDELSKIGQAIDTAAVLGSLQKIETGIKNVATKAAGAVKSLIEMGANSGQWADELTTTASQMGVDTETLQRMQYASRFVDTDVSALQTGAKRVARNRDSEAYIQQIQELQELSGKEIQLFDENGARASLDIMLDIIDALATIQENGGAVEDLASDLLGNSWDKFRPMIDAGGAQAYREEMERANVVSAESVAALASLDDANQEAQASIENLKQEVMASLAPAFEEGAKALTEFVEKLREFVNSEEGQAAIGALSEAMTNLIQTFTSEDNIEGVFTAIQTAIEKLQGALEWINNNWPAVETGIKAIGAAFGLLKVSETVLTFMQLANAAKNLASSGKGLDTAKDAAETAAGTGGSMLTKLGGGGAMSKLASLASKAAPALPMAAVFAAAGLGSYALDKHYTEQTYGGYHRAEEKRDTVNSQWEEQTGKLREDAEKANANLEEAKSLMQDMGTVSDEVAEAQQKLADAGYDIGETGIDGIWGENTQAAAEQYVADMEAAAKAIEDFNGAQVAQRDHISEMMNAAFDLENMDEEDYLGGLKDFWDNYAAELEESFPDMDIWQLIKDHMGTDGNASDYSIDELLESGFQMPNFDTFATQAAENLTNAMEEGITSGSDGVTTAVGTMTETATQQAESDLSAGGQTGGEGFDAAIASAIASNAAIVQAAAAQLGAEAAAAFDAAYRSSVGAPAGYSGGGRHSQSTGSQNVQIIMELDGQQIGEAVAPVVDQRIGTSAKRRP